MISVHSDARTRTTSARGILAQAIGFLALAVSCGHEPAPSPEMPPASAAVAPQAPAVVPSAPVEQAAPVAPAAPDPKIPVGLSVGDRAPDFEAQDVEGTRFKLSDYRGKVVVLDFWGFW